jgi:restriction endonuclease
LDSALLRINVSSHALLLLTFFVSNQPAIAAIVEHSQGKDKLLISSLKKIYEAQDLEDELNQERRTNQTLLARIQELTGQREAECREKNSKCAHRSL